MNERKQVNLPPDDAGYTARFGSIEPGYVSKPTEVKPPPLVSSIHTNRNAINANGHDDRHVVDWGVPHRVVAPKNDLAAAAETEISYTTPARPGPRTLSEAEQIVRDGRRRAAIERRVRIRRGLIPIDWNDD